MDPRRVVFDSGLARRTGGGAQMLLFGGGGSANSGGFFQGVPSAVLGGGMEEARKRPFFTTHEELVEEEYYDEQGPEKKRRLTAEQVQMLERSFEEENKLEPERKSELARRLGMAPRQVAVWFQNRRARWKNKQLEHDFDRLKAAYDALAADHHGILSDNDRLRAQVLSLTEKLQGKETSSPLPPEATAAVGAMATPPAQKLITEDPLGSGTNDGAVVLDIAEGTNHSGESTYFAAGQYGGGGALSSEEEDGGAVRDEGCSLHHLTDAMLAAGAEVHHATEEEAQLGSLSSWFWND